jgi:hypothetical protein
MPLQPEAEETEKSNNEAVNEAKEKEEAMLSDIGPVREVQSLYEGVDVAESKEEDEAMAEEEDLKDDDLLMEDEE